MHEKRPLTLSTGQKIHSETPPAPHKAAVTANTGRVNKFMKHEAAQCGERNKYWSQQKRVK